MGSRGQVLASGDLVKDPDKLEEVFWTSRPKQRHINFYRLDILIPILGLDFGLEVIQLVR